MGGVIAFPDRAKAPAEEEAAEQARVRAYVDELLASKPSRPSPSLGAPIFCLGMAAGSFVTSILMAVALA